MYIENIKSPQDVKRLNYEQLNSMCDELRNALLEKLSAHGGHIAPNLGFLEATVALHYVFNSPVDKFVFDVSHQCYVHKMLTGRMEAFTNPEKYDLVSGYTEPSESEHDLFIVGHTSTSVSLACGVAKARDLKGGNYNVIAVIGDGSLSGGEAYEGLNNAAEAGTNMIIVVNDNQMSIAENHGGLYQNLKLLRETNGKAECNFFKSMGFDYVYLNDGNDVEKLIATFKSVKDTKHPVVVHINTLKGHGYKFAEQDKETFHWGMPFDLATGKPKVSYDGENYSDLTAEYLLSEMKKHPEIVGITAGTPTVFGFTPERRKKAGKQFVDVGIAEEHAVALASGIATNGGKPVFGVFSTFIQRAYDQLSQDLAINNSPAVILVFFGSLTSMNDVTHLCFFDIPLICNIPNIVYLAPTSKEEYFAMLNWSMRQHEHPVAIRVPVNGVIASHNPVDSDYSDLNRYQINKKGSKVAIIALGSFYELGEKTADVLHEKYGIDATLINPRYISGIDSEMLDSLKHDHKLVITLEDGVLDGGFGEKITRFYGNSDIKVLNFGGKKEFVDRFDIDEFIRENHLTAELIAEDVINALK
ncbi:MAG: 1-deoxy-D-xylulose-5-phosphate synthase [Victivallaceae bacterium]